MPDEKITFIVPVYNTREYVTRCLQSIQKQTVSNFRVLVFNDGSSDGSDEIAKDFCMNDSRFSFYSHQNIGLGPTRNIGVALSETKLVSFIDSDDFIHEQFIEKMMPKHDGVDLSICSRNFLYHNEVKDVVYKPLKENQMTSVYEHFNVSVTNKVLKKNDILRLGGFTTGPFEDLLVGVKLLLNAKTIQVEETPLYFVEKRNENSITSQLNEEEYQLVINLERVSRYLHAHNIDELNNWRRYSKSVARYYIYKHLKKKKFSIPLLLKALRIAI